MEYTLILIAVLILTPFILRLSLKQDLKSKSRLKMILLILLTSQILLGFLNWEKFTAGRSGFELTLSYPNSLLGLFFAISALQIIFLIVSKTFNTFVVILNFINTVLIFIGMIRLSGILDYQVISFASIGAVFLVLFGNVIGLTYLNKDKNLLKKYLR